jgi:tRNA(Ile2)-agmatinylcytidine synthase
MQPFVSPIVKGTVFSCPRTDRGGHVFLELADGTGTIDCAAYEPTKEFRAVVRSLVPGDRIVAMGGLHRRPFTLAIEKLRIVRLVPTYLVEKPRCRRCGIAMKSMGANAGYRCKRCRTKLGLASATKILVKRPISPGLYEVPKCARRHLSMPIVR